MSGEPLYEVEGRPVFKGDVLHCPPRLFNRAGAWVYAYRSDNGSWEAVTRCDNGAVPTVKIADLSWGPHPETVAMQQLQDAGFQRPSGRDVEIWMAAKKGGAG